ncbi:pyrroline-5-carboxylate reductase [Helicobacter acinonychis]|uniref:Pyrroline-5-carboxylate reductase n=1 Tax=Helicobacter acinonychis (strain Sheeba) TaxID=382638 RepID=Q17WB2_HELAH|nr:pyrroline-5-carboxylate reductase [Helicobacter acinonychis]CAK00064.1 proC [Helicobacter acinonychis str. Sheeba]STP03715.1 pyrroline-5-carboxylate reductase [Helicobacter acinonychis]
METLQLVGYGNMAQAILEGSHEILSKHFILEITGRNPEKIAPFLKEKNIQAQIVSYPNAIDIHQKFVFLLFKPYNLKSFNYQGQAKSVLSALAGVGFEALKGAIDSLHYLKCMPNIASKFALSSTAVCEKSVVPLISQKALSIIESFGGCVRVGSEEQVDSSAATNGSVLAFLSLVASSLKDAGIREGLNARDSLELVKMSFKGFAKLLEQERPEMITEQICTPKGVTIEGLSVLEKRGVRGAFMEACHESVKKMRP